MWLRMKSISLAHAEPSPALYMQGVVTFAISALRGWTRKSENQDQEVGPTLNFRTTWDI